MANPIWMAGERIKTEEVTGRMPCIHKLPVELRRAVVAFCA